ncbi:glyoxalase family protein [Brevundimonas sp. BAL3]|uniref:VOC family protein n=1 Tax=Brevundimonas sp. BAL3 TaxID=391600 RepID=UPI00017EB740|nr:VOC family protein [Brevundimonas sp. BAL3]EDX79096.1 glyoxalase family protein [Brevundimonas sp. BAL3]
MQIIKRMDHFTVTTDRLDETLAFYEKLGLRSGPRPEFDMPGLWLYAEDHPVLHVVEASVLPDTRRGVIDHMAFAADDLNATIDMLKREGIGYKIVRTPRPWSFWQLFLEDPSGAEVELQFDPASDTPAEVLEARAARSRDRGPIA